MRGDEGRVRERDVHQRGGRVRVLLHQRVHPRTHRYNSASRLPDSGLEARSLVVFKVLKFPLLYLSDVSIQKQNLKRSTFK